MSEKKMHRGLTVVLLMFLITAVSALVTVFVLVSGLPNDMQNMTVLQIVGISAAGLLCIMVVINFLVMLIGNSKLQYLRDVRDERIENIQLLLDQRDAANKRVVELEKVLVMGWNWLGMEPRMIIGNPGHPGIYWVKKGGRDDQEIATSELPVLANKLGCWIHLIRCWVTRLSEPTGDDLRHAVSSRDRSNEPDSRQEITETVQ